MKVEVKQIDSFPENCNPFNYDLYHMGRYIGMDLLMMYANHQSEEMKYFILVNTKTGKRVRITVDGGSDDHG